jgi:prophage regulatory protein
MTRLHLMGLSEIAAHYAITRQLAQKWTHRSDFPEPLAELAQGKVWDGAEVIAWGDRHGRRAGGGPGAPKGAPRPA